MNEPKTAKARATRERILRESAQLFSVNSFHDTSLDECMARSGLTKGGFYRHFDSKEALGRAVVAYATQVWVDKVIGHLRQASGPLQRLEALLEGYRRYALDQTFEGGCFFVNLAVEMDDRNEEFAALVETSFAQFRALVAQLVRQGQAAGSLRADAPAEAVGLIVVSYLTGTMMQAKVRHDFGLFDLGNPAMVDFIRSFAVPPVA